jgi:methylmalonyl-CoA mutase
VIRATTKEKEYQIQMLERLHKSWENEIPAQLEKLKKAALENKNVFEYLMEATKYASLGQITKALFEVGGQYRRNM